MRAVSGETSGELRGEHVGAQVWQVDSSQIWIQRGADDEWAGQCRVRIWRAPVPDWDSGWVSLAAGMGQTLSHGLGGDSDDYVVDLMFRTGATVHQRFVGKDQYDSASGFQHRGVAWSALGTTSVRIHRGADDVFCDETRVRIFLRPEPSWDSGWQSLTQNSTKIIDHDLGGPWNDFYLDLQLRDADHGFGVNGYYLGGDMASAPSTTGAWWMNLSGTYIRVERGNVDIYADEARVRIWATRAPAYDSAWRAVSTGSNGVFDHGVSGDPDDYVVDVQLNDVDGTLGSGINAYKLGRDRMYDRGAAASDNRGVYWYGLTGSSLWVRRMAQDLTGEHVRVRIWQAPTPDYDSGWFDIAQGATEVLTHDLSTDPTEYVVDLQLDSDFIQVHQAAYGIDGYYSSTTETIVFEGAWWRNLDNTSVEVRRAADDQDADRARLRIWRNEAFDARTTLASLGTGSTVWAHGLGVDPHEIVVSMVPESDSTSYDLHHYQLGGDRIYYGSPYRYGSWWESLTGSSLLIWRGLEDIEADHAHVRLWHTGPSTGIFADGFESGDVSVWSNANP